MASLQTQLLGAWSRRRKQDKGFTLGRLADAAGLDCTVVSMSRKLRGLQKMSTEECEAIARVLGVRVAFGRRAA